MLNHLFDWFLNIGTTSQVLFQSILSLFAFASIELNPRLNLSFISYPMVCHQQDTILGKPSYVLYQFILLFIWFLIMETLSQVLSKLNVCSFGFSSLGQYPMFYMSLFVFPSLGHHPRLYQSLNVSSFCFLSIGPHPRLNLSFFSLHVVSHHCDIILCSISIFCFFIWLLIIGTSSQVLSILNHLFLSIS